MGEGGDNIDCRGSLGTRGWRAVDVDAADADMPAMDVLALLGLGGMLAIHGWRSRRVALGRSLGTRLKHSSRKSLASDDRQSGSGGGSFVEAM